MSDATPLASRDYERLYNELKVGYLDIESTGLKGNWDFILAYCLKERGGPILGRHLTQQEITHYKFDKNLTKELIADVLFAVSLEMGFARGTKERPRQSYGLSRLAEG